MNARLPTPAPALTPDALIKQWSPMMRRLAYTTGTDYDDIRQEAWLLAATMPRGSGSNFVARWLTAVRSHAAAQRPGVTVRPGSKRGAGEEYIGSAWLAGNADDDPCYVLQAAQTVAHRVAGEVAGEDTDDAARWQRIRQEIEMPVEPWEIAEARRVSKRQGRRDAAKIRAARLVQRDLFGVDESGVGV